MPRAYVLIIVSTFWVTEALAQSGSLCRDFFAGPSVTFSRETMDRATLQELWRDVNKVSMDGQDFSLLMHALAPGKVEKVLEDFGRFRAGTLSTSLIASQHTETIASRRVGLQIRTSPESIVATHPADTLNFPDSLGTALMYKRWGIHSPESLIRKTIEQDVRRTAGPSPGNFNEVIIETSERTAVEAVIVIHNERLRNADLVFANQLATGFNVPVVHIRPVDGSQSRATWTWRATREDKPQ